MEEADARAVAAKAARRHGEPSSESHLIRSGVHHVYRVGDLVVRVARSTADVNQHVNVGRFLGENGIAVPEVIGCGEVTGRPYSVWEYVSTDAQTPVDYKALGVAVRNLHIIELGSVEGFGLPRCHELQWLTIDRDLDLARSTDVVAPEDIDLLEANVRRLRTWRDQCDAAGLQVLCHGDVHPGNVIMRGGNAVLIDWDTICVGPPAWDHAMLLTLADRWGGHPDAYFHFADGYGQTYVAEPLAAELADLRLLAPTIAMIVKGESDDGCAAEARLRMKYWRGEQDAPSWTAL